MITSSDPKRARPVSDEVMESALLPSNRLRLESIFRERYPAIDLRGMFNSLGVLDSAGLLDNRACREFLDKHQKT